ncbi:MAG TPA: amino acid ABC transporter substrate-binding protein [Thermodesulfobacteriota bacterium]|nr:amino acid ABC transporter substrate-binding protein [Thermodesulfobacteriota bacterium]
MKRSVMTVFLAFVAVVLIASQAFSQGTKATVPVGEPIKIGGSLPLTGLASEQAKWVKAGYEFWAEDINKRGGLLGRPVKLIIYDDESNAEKAVTYYERAITVDKVDFVFGGYPGTSNVALMPLVEKYGKVFVGQGGHMKSFEQGFTYSFGSPPLMSEWVYLSFAPVLDELIPKQDWPKSMAMLTMNNVIGLSARPNMIKAFEERGVKVVVNETYNLPLSDATPLVSKAKGMGAEILACMSFFDDGVMITRAAKAMNYNPKLYMQQLASRIPAWMKELGPDGDNVLGNSYWAPGLPYPGNDKIYQGAKEKLGMPVPPDFFGQAFCWIYTLEIAVKGAGTLDNMKVRDYLRSRPFDLPYGKGIKFDSKGLPPAFALTVQTVGGVNKLLLPKDLAQTKLVYPRPPWSK